MPPISLTPGCAAPGAHPRAIGAAPARARARRQRGFTLVELIISAGLIGFLALTATWFWVDSFSLVRSVNADSAAIADGRATLERLAREIREVKLDPASGAFCVSTMAATQMVFNKTSGAAVATGCGGATPTSANADFAVNIQTVGSTLNLGYAGALAAPATTKALTSVASSFGLRYLDINFAVTTSASALRYVELSLTLQPPGVQATPSRTVVALRNN